MRGSARWPPGAPVQRAKARPEGRPSPFAACRGGAAPAAPPLRPSPSSRGRRWGGPLAGARRPGSRGGLRRWRSRDGLRVEWASAALAGGAGYLPPQGGVGAVGPHRADLAALRRLSVARWPSLASPPASRGFGARGERHLAARLSPRPRVPGSSLSFSCACTVLVSEGQSMPFGPKSPDRG